MTALPSRTL